MKKRDGEVKVAWAENFKPHNANRGRKWWQIGRYQLRDELECGKRWWTDWFSWPSALNINYTLVEKSRGRSDLEMSQIGPSLEHERFFLILEVKCLNAVARGPPVTIWLSSRFSTTWIHSFYLKWVPFFSEKFWKSRECEFNTTLELAEASSKYYLALPPGSLFFSSLTTLDNLTSNHSRHCTYRTFSVIPRPELGLGVGDFAMGWSIYSRFCCFICSLVELMTWLRGYSLFYQIHSGRIPNIFWIHNIFGLVSFVGDLLRAINFFYP